MASIAVVVILLSLCYLTSVEPQLIQSPSINYVTPKDCKMGVKDIFHEYFDYASLSCKQCSENSTLQTSSADRLTCVCQPNYKYLKNFGGLEVKCEKCGDQQTVSSDGWECLDVTTNKCSGDKDLYVEREIDGSWNISYTKLCKTCVINTTLNSVRSKCVRCSDFLAIRPDLKTCICDADTNKASGLCFKTEDRLVTSTGNRMFEIPLTANVKVNSYYFMQNLQAAEVLCRIYKKLLSCQQLANMCVLLLYDVGSTRTGNIQACVLFQNIQNNPTIGFISKPMLFYVEKADNVLVTNDLQISYTFSPPVTLTLKVAAYDIDGNYLGIKDVNGGLLQLCSESDTKLDAAYIFGTVYKQKCSIPGVKFWDQNKYPLVFYDPYLEYEENKVKKLYKVPILVTNYLDQSSKYPNTGGIQDWKLTRRFFMVDNVATIQKAEIPSKQSEENATYVRYVSSMTLVITLQGGTTEGKINPPYLKITYADISRIQANEGNKASVTFEVTYDMDLSKYNRNFQIAAGTLSTLGVLYAGYRAWVWSKRDGRIAIDFPTIVNFIFYLSGSLSNVFFVVTFGIAFYWHIFFKRQDAVFLLHPTGTAVKEWEGLFGAAFALKVISIIHLIFSQCFIDIFFIDWERPKASEKSPKPVSIWRTYFVANEWNELQTSRKINQYFQIFAVVFFVSVVGFENVNTLDPNGQIKKSADEYQAPQSPIFRYSTAALTYILVALLQWLFFTLFYERFIEDKVFEFIDLCSMANISVFILSNAEYGYYIHGRSVHGKADTDMKEIAEMLKKEEDNLVGKRGLEPDTDEQTFQMRIPRSLREKYRNTFQNMALANMNRQQNDQLRFESYAAINRLLAAFIDHSLRGIDYTVKQKTLLEGIMDTEFIDITSEKGILFSDNGHSFDQVLFYGHEFTLMTFELLIFCTVDYMWQNYVLAGILTYLVSEIVAIVRRSGGLKNIVQKTLVDKRFLI